MPQRLLSLAEIAANLGVSLRVLRAEIAAGNGPATIRVGARLFVAPDDADEWLRARRRAPGPRVQQGEAA